MGCVLMTTLVHDADAKLAQWGYTYASFEECVAAYQRNHAPHLDDLCRAVHSRPLRVDGDIGPATAHLMNTRFCNVPDVMPNATVEQANWPTACRNDITVSWGFDQLPGLTEAETDLIFERMKEKFESRFEMTIKLQKDDYPKTRIYMAVKALPGPTLAWSYLATSNCADRLKQAIDNTIRWSFKLADGTVPHEDGHAFGMVHTPQDPKSLMYPSMNGQTDLNKTDIEQMIRLGYKRRTSSPDTGWGMW